MNKALFSLMLTALAVSPGCSKRKEFAIPIHLVRKDGKSDVKGFTILAQEFGDSKILGQDPGVTDANGDATIRFESEEEMVEMHYLVQEAPGDERWYVRFHGFLPTGDAELPQHSAHALPVKSTPLPMEAFSASQCAAVAKADLTKNNTTLIATAVAAAVAVPGAKTTETGTIKLNDPLLSSEQVARTLHTSAVEAKDLIEEWQKALDRTPANAKPDEKSLAALVKGDLVKAADFADAAHKLPADQKAKLTGIRDTSRLVETVYQLNTAALENPGVPPTPGAATELKKVRERLLRIRLPEENASGRRRIDRSGLENFSRTAGDRIPR